MYHSISHQFLIEKKNWKKKVENDTNMRKCLSTFWRDVEVWIYMYIFLGQEKITTLTSPDQCVTFTTQVCLWGADKSFNLASC